ncbi:MAG: hypothetical protein Q8N36_04580, partial [bacterium]|nr:hypothetical protein [bacterium]
AEGVAETLGSPSLSGLMAAAYKAAAVDITEYTINLLTGLAANKPIYAKGSLERYSANNVIVDITEVKLGIIPLPAATLKTLSGYVSLFVNTHITSENGFSIQELRVIDGQLFYRGTLPAEIRGTKLP